MCVSADDKRLDILKLNEGRYVFTFVTYGTSYLLTYRVDKIVIINEIITSNTVKIAVPIQ